MLDHLPDLIDPYEFAEKRRRIKGALPLSGMDRLSNAILNPGDTVTIDLEFKMEGRFAAVVGKVESALALRCQCCLEALDWQVRSEVRLGVVRSIDEADILPAGFEPLLMESEAALAVRNLVEDELLLAIPVVPQHPDCRLPHQPAKIPEPKRHPFADLAQLKKSTL
jgi:uncharacterized protein